MSFIAAIANVVPSYKHHQKDILNFMLNAFQADETERRKIGLLYKQSGIQTRYSTIEDYSTEMADWQFYPTNTALEPFPNVTTRMQIYNEKAPQLALEASLKCLEQVNLAPKQVTHLITMSCTGLSAPGLDIMLMEKLELNNNIYRTSINFMGCYAGFHALKMADLICRTDQKAHVLIVGVELCTLHFQKDKDMDSITSSLLFADGASAILVTSQETSKKLGKDALALTSFYAEVTHAGQADMAWQIGQSGFLMTLSAYVPKIIKQEIKSLVDKALDKANLTLADIEHWAIHPGGKRILDFFYQEMALIPEDLTPSYEVLSEYGNMSSVTIFFVLEKWWQKLKQNKEKSHIFAAGFGPGLTMETAILQHIIF